jgi:hypothetical protein
VTTHQPTTPTSPPARAASAVVGLLCDENGFRAWWSTIDSADRKALYGMLADAIAEQLGEPVGIDLQVSGPDANDQPTTPRAALLALAQRIDTGKVTSRPDVALVELAGLLIQEAERYPDEPAPDPVTAELVGEPTLDVDQQLRVEALQAASHWHLGCALDDGVSPQDVVTVARVFEGYLNPPDGQVGPQDIPPTLATGGLTGLPILVELTQQDGSVVPFGEVGPGDGTAPQGIAEAVLAELEGRSGFDGWWGGIDADIRSEIRAALAERIEHAMRGNR